MRSLTFIFALLASQLLPFAPVAAASAKVNRRYPSPTTKAPVADALALRQHVERRSLLDVCAYIDLDLGLGLDLLGLPTSELAGLKLCLCLSALPLALETDLQLKALGDKWGKDLITAVLKLLIGSGPNSRHCTYPDHADPVCSSGDPCGYHCHEPYVKEGNKCVCAPPFVDCNGKCVPASQGCGSAVPRALAARSESLMSRAQSSCQASETVCGVYGNLDKNAFECIDIQKNLESCGGCMVSNPFAPRDASAPTGRDCTLIPHVDDVDCIRGVCNVTKCVAGFALNAAQDGCVPAHGATSASRKDALKVQRKSVASRHFAKRERDEPTEHEAAEGERHGTVYANAYFRE